jgi:hypothetical protein
MTSISHTLTFHPPLLDSPDSLNPVLKARPLSEILQTEPSISFLAEDPAVPPTHGDWAYIS